MASIIRIADLGAALGHDPAGAALLALQLLDPVDQRRDLPVGEPRHRLAHGPGEVDREVEVEHPGVDELDHCRQGADVTLGERDRGSVLREAQRAPEPLRLLDRRAGLRGDLECGEDRLLAEHRALEVVAG